MSSAEQINETVKGYLEEQFLIDFGDSVQPQSNLFKSGLIDSYGFIDMVTFLEQEFSINFSDEELASGVLTSLSGIAEAVSRKLHD